MIDVNVLLALSWPNHVHHSAAQDWFGSAQNRGWATCLPVQVGFLRLCMTPQVVDANVSYPVAITKLLSTLAHPKHEYWQIDFALPEIESECKARITGINQIPDAVLLTLAIRQGAKLATFDRRIRYLLANQSPLQRHIEVID